jgi:protein TonB
MDRAQTLFPSLSLDPKRIAGTSVAITVHVMVLMLLMLPAQKAPSKPEVEDTPMVVTPTYIKPIPLTPLPLPKPHLIVQQTQRHPPVTPQTDPVDNTTSPVDPYVPPQEHIIADTFKPQLQETPAFAQISADIAPAPPYPAMALKHEITGVVTLRVRVDALGRPVEVIVENSSGSKLLDDAALKFVRARWHFVPAMQNGAAIEAYALVPINFVIER